MQMGINEKIITAKSISLQISESFLLITSLSSMSATIKYTQLISIQYLDNVIDKRSSDS